jgi:hypothetical protein
MKPDACDWTADTFGALKRLLAKAVSETVEWFSNKGRFEELSEASVEEQHKAATEALRAAVARTEPRLDPNTALDGEEGMAGDWAERSSRAKVISRDSAEEQWMKTSAEQWRQAGCAVDGAPYVARALHVRTGQFFPARKPSSAKCRRRLP